MAGQGLSLWNKTLRLKGFVQRARGLVDSIQEP